MMQAASLPAPRRPVVTAANYDLITVGRVNMDLYAQDIGADFADVTGFDAMVGGSPSNIAIATSRLGLRSVAFTGIGAASKTVFGCEHFVY